MMGGDKREFGSIENKELKYEQWRAKKKLMVGELTNWQEKGKGFLDGGEGKRRQFFVGDDDIEHGLGQFSTLVASDDSSRGKPVDVKELIHDIQRWLFRFSKENPNVARCLINDCQVRGVPVVQFYDAVFRWIGASIFRCEHPHKTEIHEETLTLM